MSKYADNHSHLAFKSLCTHDERVRVIRASMLTLTDDVDKKKIESYLVTYLDLLDKHRPPLSQKEDNVRAWLDHLKNNQVSINEVAAILLADLRATSMSNLMVEFDDHHRLKAFHGSEGELPIHWSEVWKPDLKFLILALEEVNQISSVNDAMQLINIVVSVAGLHNDLRFASKESNQWEHDRIVETVYFNKEAQQDTVKYPESTFRQGLSIFFNKILDGSIFKESLSHDLKRDIGILERAIIRAHRVRDVRCIDVPSYISMSSSGARFNKASLSRFVCRKDFDKSANTGVPALLADPYERIPDCIKSLPVYGNGLMKDPEFVLKDTDKLVKSNQFGRFCVIEQNSKTKKRGIHITPNFIQDRLAYFHKLYADIMKHIDYDYTTCQHVGYFKLKDLTDPEICTEFTEILSLDLTAASDTWCIEHQADCLRFILAFYLKTQDEIEEMVSTWKTLMTYPEEVVYHGETHIWTMPAGQPQGKLHSFDSFAMAHHINTLYARYIAENYTENTYSKSVQGILGDDMFFAASDRELTEAFQEFYIWIMKSCGVVCNPNKGYSCTKGEPRIAEFAKVLCMQGKVISPAPVNLLCQVRDATTAMKYISWRMSYDDTIDVDTVVSNINSLFPDNGFNDIRMLIIILVDLRLISLGRKPRFEEEYADDLWNKCLYFHDYWMLRDSFLKVILTEKAVKELPFEYTYDQLVNEMISRSRIWKPVIKKQLYANSKLAEIVDREMLKKFIFQKYSESIEPSDDDLIGIYLSYIHLNNQNLSAAFDTAIEVLSYDPSDVFQKDTFEYKRDDNIKKVINSMRGRSFTNEIHEVNSSKLQELDSLITYNGLIGDDIITPDLFTSVWVDCDTLDW